MLQKLNDWLITHPVVRKPLNTFWQAFLVVFAAGMSNVMSAFAHGGLAAVQASGLALLVAAGAAGLSALKTYVIETLKEK